MRVRRRRRDRQRRRLTPLAPPPAPGVADQGPSSAVPWPSSSLRSEECGMLGLLLISPLGRLIQDAQPTFRQGDENLLRESQSAAGSTHCLDVRIGILLICTSVRASTRKSVDWNWYFSLRTSVRGSRTNVRCFLLIVCPSGMFSHPCWTVPGWDPTGTRQLRIRIGILRPPSGHRSRKSADPWEPSAARGRVAPVGSAGFARHHAGVAGASSALRLKLKLGFRNTRRAR